MSCQTYETDMFSWRPGCDVAEFKALFDHMTTCPECALRFAKLTAQDQEIRKAFHQIPASPTLEGRIFAGLAHERRQEALRNRRWPTWAWASPLAAVLLLTIGLGLMPFLREARFEKQIAILRSQPPAEQISSNDQKELLAWSAAALRGFTSFPPELQKVTFRSASVVALGQHEAVLLRMKNERRASLLVVNGVLTQTDRRQFYTGANGSDSHWSKDGRTYVLLFNGSAQELNHYMQQMGITA